MAKIAFDDRSYIEISKSDTPNKVFITIAAKSTTNSNELLANCVELTNEQLLTLVHSVSR